MSSRRQQNCGFEPSPSGTAHAKVRDPPITGHIYTTRTAALKATRDRALVFVLVYTAVRVGELLRDPNDPRRRGVRWEDLSLDDGSIDVYQKNSSGTPPVSPIR